MRKLFVLAGFCIFGAVEVQADPEMFSKTIVKVGAQGAGSYFSLEGGLIAPCKWDVIYFSGSNYQSLILAAKMAGKKLSRVVYTVDANGFCNLALAEVE